MNMNRKLLTPLALAAALATAASSAKDDPAGVVAALDTEYQAAVERNDWQVMDRILHPDFTLVLGNGDVYSRADLIASARGRHIMAPASGHWILIDEPEIVISAIESVLREANPTPAQRV